MKVAILTARIAPVRCGVGDHSVRLAHHLAERGDRVVLITASSQVPYLANVAPAKFSISNCVPAWSWRGMRRFYKAVRAEKPDVLVVQWVPQLYGRGGITLALPLTLALLAFRGTKIHLMVHETWVNFTSLPLFFMGVMQRLAMVILVKSSQRIGVSIDAWTSMLRAWFPKQRDQIQTIPAFSNIPYLADTEGALTARLNANIPPNATVLGVFSLSGSGKAYSFIETAWEKILDSNEQVFLVVIGASVDDAKRYLPRLINDHRCRFTGFLQAEEVSHWLQSIDLLLAPFTDGVSSRRGSVLAAISHGVPVVTTRGRLTDRVLFEGGPLVLSHLDEDAFANEVVALLQDDIRRKKLAATARGFYKKHFSIERVAEMLVPQARLVKSEEKASGV